MAVTAPTPSPEAVMAAWEALELLGLDDVDRHDVTAALDAAYAVDMPAERERRAVAIENTPHPHDVFLKGEVGTWVKARRLFAAIARAGGVTKEADHE